MPFFNPCFFPSAGTLHFFVAEAVLVPLLIIAAAAGLTKFNGWPLVGTLHIFGAVAALMVAAAAGGLANSFYWQPWPRRHVILSPLSSKLLQPKAGGCRIALQCMHWYCTWILLLQCWQLLFVQCILETALFNSGIFFIMIRCWAMKIIRIENTTSVGLIKVM